MKTLTIISISAAFVLASCGSSRYAAYGEYDDVYYNPASNQDQAYVAPQSATSGQAAFNAQQTMATQPLDQDTSYLKGLSDY